MMDEEEVVVGTCGSFSEKEKEAQSSLSSQGKSYIGE